MKTIRLLALMALTGTLLVSAAVGIAADTKEKEKAKAKPYPLKTCLVADDKLDADAYTFVHEGQEIKLCCESCIDDFKKEPAKYLKKIKDAEKKK